MTSIDDVQDLSPRNQYVAAADQTAFDYTFPIFLDADLVVDIDGEVQVLTTDYTVSGKGNDTGGTVTLIRAIGEELVGGEVVTIYRDIAIARDTDIQQNGPWSSVSYNDEMDKVFLIMQELKNKIGRAIRFPITSASTNAQAEMAPISGFLGKFLRITSAGILEAATALDNTVALSAEIIGQLLNPQTAAEVTAGVTIVDYSKEYGNVLRYGTNTTPGTTDMTTAINSAISVAQQSGGTVFIPAGSYLVSANIAQNQSKVQIHGEGNDATFIVAAASFPDAEVFTIGNPDTTSTRLHCGLRDMTIDVANDASTIGVGWYGCRDGSYMKDIYIKNHTGTAFKFGMAGAGTGSAALKMSQGCVFERLIAVNTGAGVTGDVFDIDGTYESVFLMCRALGSSAQSDGQVDAFSVAEEGDCRGLSFIGCTGVHYQGTAGSCVIHYGEWARECWDMFTTGENIEGSVIRFDGGSGSGSALPANCRSYSCRPFISATAGILDPVLYFGSANSCYGEVMNYSSSKGWVEFAGSGGSADTNNSAFINTTVAPQTLTTTLLTFGGSTNNNNIVRGVCQESTGSANGYKVEFVASNSGISKTSQVFPGVVTLGSANTTPSVRGMRVVQTANLASTVYTAFDDGEAGQELVMIIGDNNSSFDVTGTTLNAGTTDLTVASGDILKWVCEDGTDWHLIGFMDASVDNSGGA